MPYIAEPTLTHAVSRDGTVIGYFTSGEGPPLVLVQGSLGDHTRWEALRPHLPRELRAPPESAFSDELAKAVSVPALVLVGSDTPRPFGASAQAVAAALPNAELVVLDGQGHGAEVLAPEAVAEPVLRFLRSGTRQAGGRHPGSAAPIPSRTHGTHDGR